jgi:hypothetical protein
MSSSELHNRSHPSAQNANLLNKWASNKSAIQALPSNLKVAKKTRSLASLSKNLQINFLKCDGVIAPVSNAVGNKQFTLTVSTLTYFVNYTDFNKLNPDASVLVQPQVFSVWYTNYISAKNQTDGKGFLPYQPSTIVSYHDKNSGKKLNYICKITNIVLNHDASGNPIPVFTFDTSTVKFYDKNSISTKKTAAAAAAAVGAGASASDVYDVITSSKDPIVNDSEVTKIDTNFLTGLFRDIRIDFDPLYDSSYKYSADYSYFLQSDMTIVNNNGKCQASVDKSHRFIMYRSWSPKDEGRNEELEVYVDDISYFTRMFGHILSNRIDTPQDLFKPSTTLEFRKRDGSTSTIIVQITDCYVHQGKIIFELDNEIVKIKDDSGEYVQSYKSISKILREGTHTYSQVRMDIDSGGCGSFPSPATVDPALSGMCVPCKPYQGCFYSWDCCGCNTSTPDCPDSCNCFCSNTSLTRCDTWCAGQYQLP